jgi:MFS family permease
MQIPSNMPMSSSKIRPSRFMSVCMISWAVVSALTSLTKNYVSLVLVRFFLGVTEAPFYPGALFLLSLFYTRKEIALRISILYTGNIVATAVAGMIAAATFATLDGAHDLKGWQWLFIIEGVVTLFIAILGLFMLPDHPLTTKWLTSEERTLAHDRITKDTVGHEESKGVLTALREALRDPRLYLLAFMQNMHLSACGFNNYFPTVVGSLGFNRTMTLVLTCPPYLVSGLSSIVVGITSGRFNERTWHITVSMAIAVAGFIISCVTLNTAARYVACFLFSSGAYAVNSVILGWVSATLGQTPEKKAASLSIVNVVANASYIYTAYLYPKSDGPRYLTGMSANAAFGVLTIVSAWGLRIWLQKTNRKIRDGRLPCGNEGILYAY